MKLHQVAALVGLVAPACLAGAQAWIAGLGFLPGDESSSARGISADGSVVVGQSVTEPVQWHGNGEIEELGLMQGVAIAASSDGSVIVGYGVVNLSEAFRWTAQSGSVGLGFVGDDSSSYARGVSADGSVVVGDSWSVDRHEAFLWTAAGGMKGLGFLPGGEYSIAHGVSADGTVVVGSCANKDGYIEAFRWTEATGMVGLGFLSNEPFPFSEARGVSGDGSIVVGSAGFEGRTDGFRWTASSGMQSIGGLNNYAVAVATSDDGSVIVGWDTFADFIPAAAIWTEEGPHFLQDFLVGHGANLDEWGILYQAWGVSADGTKIVGQGLHDGVFEEAWIAYVPPICYADIDGSGDLTLFDFLAFVNLFNAQDPAADWNKDGVFDLFDFLGFVNAFNGGC